MRTKIKLAASVILARGPADDPEVYLARRAPELKFFGGFWVFPGGNVSRIDYHEEDDPEELALQRCAVREILEEIDVLCATLGKEFSREQKQALKQQIKDAPEQWQQFLAQFDSGLALVTPLYRITTSGHFFPFASIPSSCTCAARIMKRLRLTITSWSKAGLSNRGR